MNAYRGITVVDEAENQDRTAPVILTTINCDGVINCRHFSYKTL